MNNKCLIKTVAAFVLCGVAFGCSSFKGRAFVRVDKPIVTEIGPNAKSLRKIVVKDELVALNENVVVQTEFRAESGYLSVALINQGNAPVRIHWPESSVMIEGENPLRPIPYGQLKANSSEAPSHAAVTVVPPGGKYVDLITAIERLETVPIYTTITQGIRTVGTFQSGTRLSTDGLISSGVSFDAIVERKEESTNSGPGIKRVFQSDEDWAKSVQSVLNSRYLNKSLVFMPVIEVEGVKRTLSISMKVSRVEALIKDNEIAKKEAEL